MKKIILLVAMTVFGLSVGKVDAQILVMKANLQALVQKSILSTTNPPNTNMTYATLKVKITTQDILNILQAEFGTLFPDGAQLALDINNNTAFEVLDKNGAFILDVSTNPADSSYFFYLTNRANIQVIAGKVAQTPTQTSEIVTETLPDYDILYADQHNNNFHVGGIITLKANAVVTTNTVYKSLSLTLPGTGSGTFFDHVAGTNENGVITGSWVGTKLKGS